MLDRPGAPYRRKAGGGDQAEIEGLQASSYPSRLELGSRPARKRAISDSRGYRPPIGAEMARQPSMQWPLHAWLSSHLAATSPLISAGVCSLGSRETLALGCTPSSPTDQELSTWGFPRRSALGEWLPAWHTNRNQAGFAFLGALGVTGMRTLTMASPLWFRSLSRVGFPSPSVRVKVKVNV